MLNRTERHWSLIRSSAPVFPLIAALLMFLGCGGDSPQAEANDSTQDQSATTASPTQTSDETPTENKEMAEENVDETSADSKENMESPTNEDESATNQTEEKAPEATMVKASNSSPDDMPGKTSPEPGGADGQNSYDPATFDALLKGNVSNGKVNYSAFKGNQQFTNFLQSIESASLDGMSVNQKLAFWVNAYNALVIKNVNSNPGIKQPLDVPGFFDKKKFTAAGRSVTLNQIENEIVRPTFNEPLIHFGLVCAAVSCPPLINKAYTAGNVRSQLARNARTYLANAKQNRFEGGTLYLSKIFEWYKEDFGGNDAGLIAFAKKYGTADMKAGLGDGTAVKFNEYDWTLNKR